MATHIELEIIEFAIRTALENGWLEDKKWGELKRLELHDGYNVYLFFENKNLIVNFTEILFDEDFARGLFYTENDKFGKVSMYGLTEYTRGYKCHLAFLAIKGEMGLRLDYIQNYLENAKN